MRGDDRGGLEFVGLVSQDHQMIVGFMDMDVFVRDRQAIGHNCPKRCNKKCILQKILPNHNTFFRESHSQSGFHNSELYHLVHRRFEHLISGVV